MNSPIRWAGSKRQMLGVLLPMAKDLQGTYIEPFAGSASLFFALEPREAILGDLNGELIGALRQLRDNSCTVLSEMRKLGTDSNSYYALREVDPANLTGSQASARFFILNKLCFNGLYRTNMVGKFNVPYGRHKTLSVDFEILEKATSLLETC
jgi:DNA adenine methylase